MVFFMDTMAAINGSWIIPVTVFPFKFFRVSTIEVYIFGFTWALYAVLFYEHFFDKVHHGGKISRQFKYALYIFLTLSLPIILIYFSDRRLLNVPYFYFITGILFILLPLALFLFRYPKYLPRFAILAIYFFLVLIVYEITALKTGEWIYVGRYLGYVQLFNYKFPFEEFFFWTILCTPALLSYYEFFADHKKLNSKRF